VVTVNIAVAEMARKDKRNRPGFCIDTGAPTSVVGLTEVRRIANSARKRLKLRSSSKRFRFADATFDSLGRVFLPLATPCGVMAIYVPIDVVAADIPALMGLDVMDQHKLYVNTVTNRSSDSTVMCTPRWPSRL